MTEGEAIELWRKYRDSNHGTDSGVGVKYRGAEGDNDPHYFVSFAAEALSGKLIHDLLTEVQGTELSFSVATDANRPAVVIS